LQSESWLRARARIEVVVYHCRKKVTKLPGCGRKKEEPEEGCAWDHLNRNYSGRVDRDVKGPGRGKLGTFEQVEGGLPNYRCVNLENP